MNKRSQRSLRRLRKLFLNYTSQQWLEENKLVVENGIRNELSESLHGWTQALFEDHYVTLPDEKYDIFESMVAKLDDMEDKLNETNRANVSPSSQMSGFQRETQSPTSPGTCLKLPRKNLLVSPSPLSLKVMKIIARS